MTFSDSRMKAGMSSGLRDVTRLRSTATSSAPAFRRSSRTVFQAVMTKVQVAASVVGYTKSVEFDVELAPGP